MKSVRVGTFVRRVMILLVAWICIFTGGASAQQPTSPPAAPVAPGPAKEAVASKIPDFREDWGSISISDTDLAPMPPVFGELADLPGNTFTRELLQVQWRPEDPIDLYIIRPRGIAKPPVVLYLYGYTEDTDRFKQDGWCSRVTAGGYAAVGFVSALSGHRYHDRPMKEWFVSELQESLGKTTHDVQLILNYLATRGDLDMDHVGMFATGSGATVAILAAAADPRIKAIDLLNPWGDWPEWLAKSSVIPEKERATYLKPEFLDRVAPLDPIRWLPKLTATKIRFKDLRENPFVPDSVQEHLEAAAPETAEINQYGDGRAFFTHISGQSFDWIKDQVKAGAKQQNVAAGSERIHVYPAEAQIPH